MKRFALPRSHPVAAGTLIAACLIASPFAVAATGDVLREGVRNGTEKESEIIGDVNASSGKGGYVTRQSNITTGNNAGGAAIYGCRAPTGGTEVGSAPCLRASNLAGGFSFEFASSGAVGGLISLGDPKLPNAGKPFVTNATGIATGLNADMVDGKHAADLVGATGPTGPAGTAGPPGATGPTGATGPAGTAVAYATIEDDGTVVATKSQNITQANVDPDTQVGIVCFTGLAFTPKNVVVTSQGVFNGGQEDVVASAFVSTGNVSSGDCSGKLQVRTYDISNAARADRPFMIWFHE